MPCRRRVRCPHLTNKRRGTGHRAHTRMHFPERNEILKIDKIKINGFGKIKNKEIELREGINIIYGENEAGKTSLLKCIQALFYGLVKTKNGKNISDFDQYKPWEDTEFSGKIKYTLDNGEEYEVFREFKKKNPVIYQNNEDISSKFKIDKTKGIHFFEEQTGIDENLFCHTAIVSQQEVKLEKADTNAIVQKISNLVSTGDDTISFKKSMDTLNKWQNEKIGTDRTKERPINIANENIKRLTNERDNLKNSKENLISYATQKEHITLELQELQEKKETLKQEKQISNDNEIKNVEINLKIKISILLGILFFVITVVLLALKKFGIAIIPAIFGLVTIFTTLKMYQQKGKNSDFDSGKIEKEIEKIDARINDLKLKNTLIDAEKSKIDENLEKLIKVEEELEEQKRIKEELLSLETSYLIAKEALSKAYEKIKNNLSPQFEQKLCEITSNITDGKYENIAVNDENGLLVEVENGAYMPVDRLSVGTIDEMYLALRLSILSEISKEKMPILFDETFAYFDNQRLKNIICHLQDKNYENQIVIFTCSNREEQVLNQLKIEYNLISLEK